MINVTVPSRARAGVAGRRAPRLPGPAPAVAHPPRQLHRRSALERPPEPDIINQCGVDPDTHRTALIWLSCIRIRIGNTNPDPGNLQKFTNKRDIQPFITAFVLT